MASSMTLEACTNRDLKGRAACVYVMDMNTQAAIKLLLDYNGAAQALSMSRAALRDLVYKGRGPVTTKIGRRTFFAVKDLEEFIDRHREAPVPVVSDQPPAPRKRGRGRPTVAERIARDASFRR